MDITLRVDLEYKGVSSYTESTIRKVTYYSGPLADLAELFMSAGTPLLMTVNGKDVRFTRNTVFSLREQALDALRASGITPPPEPVAPKKARRASVARTFADPASQHILVLKQDSRGMLRGPDGKFLVKASSVVSHRWKDGMLEIRVRKEGRRTEKLLVAPPSKAKKVRKR